MKLQCLHELNHKTKEEGFASFVPDVHVSSFGAQVVRILFGALDLWKLIISARPTSLMFFVDDPNHKKYKDRC